MEKSRRWYEYVLGMSTWLDTEFVLSGEGIAIGSAGDKTHLVIMRAEHDKIGMIGLLQWLDPPLASPRGSLPRCTLARLYSWWKRMMRQSLRDGLKNSVRACTPRERKFTVTGAKGETRHLVGTALFDPDGHFFECNQVLFIDEPGATS